MLAHKRQARDLKGRDHLRAELPGIEALMQRWVDSGRHLGSMVTRTLGVLDSYGAPVVREALGEMLARGTHDPGRAFPFV